MLHRILLTCALFLLAAAPAGAHPRAHAAAEQRAADAALEQVERLSDGRGVRGGHELTHALRELSLGLRHLRGAERERAESLLARPTDEDAADDERWTIPEAPGSPICSANFCVHFVLTGPDAGAAAFATSVLAEAEAVQAVENGRLGWRRPPSDGDGRVDIFLKELGASRLFGFAATDPGQGGRSHHSYLVLDNDFDPAQYGGAAALDSLKVTLAHEYGHVIQYGYDVTADGWHFESGAVWFEHEVHPQVADWLRFLQDRPGGAGWRSLTELPLTAYNDPADEDRNAKPYGSVVWNFWLDRRHGARANELQRASWELSNGARAPSTAAYDSAIKAVGGPGLAGEFSAFAAAVAEWQLPSAGFPEPASLPDVERVGSLAADGAGSTNLLDHLTFALYDVPDTAAARIRLAASFPAGTHAALALVARAGDQATVRFLELPAGGSGGVTLADPRSYTAAGGRITAVLVNADARQSGYDAARTDWRWGRDDQPVSARVTTDTTGPRLDSHAPAAAARAVSTATRVRATFSEPVSNVNAATFILRDARGRLVPASVAYDAANRTATLTPRGSLSDTTTYSARLTAGILDAAATPMGPVEWSFTTLRRAPRAALMLLPASNRGALLRLRSRDTDRLRWVAILRAGGRQLARREGTLAAGATRAIRLSSAVAGRASLTVTLVDPQGNTRRLRRALRIGRQP